MSERVPSISHSEFLRHYLQNAQHLMWFLGAGASRSAGLPTAADIIWDLKRRYYCLHENQDVQSHDINNKTIRQKIQAYMDSKGFPQPGGPNEYPFYFELNFDRDNEAQQKYIYEALAPGKVSLNIGHRVLAALLEMGLVRIIFSTNFDEVMETAYAAVSGKNLPVFHLEGSYAAVAALNGERFPLYCKIHGDFRYQSIKNLPENLRNNDREIQKCFLAAATRYGLVVSGYSGRDENVISMFREAIDQNNAFPQGLFWTVPRLSGLAASVLDLIEHALHKGVKAHVVETGTLDELLSKIWRQVQEKPRSLDEKVRSARVASVSIPLPAPGNRYPILRTNALPVIGLPTRCGTVEFPDAMTFSELKEKTTAEPLKAIATFTDKILFWGDEEEIIKVLTRQKVKSTPPFEFGDVMQEVAASTFVKSFFEEALVAALCSGKPLFLRRKGKTYYAVVRDDATQDKIFADLRSVLGANGQPAALTGKVPGLQDVAWAEAVSIRLEERGGKVWVMLKPDIWIKPLARRQEARDFMRQRRIRRYNSKSYHLLNAWIGILLGAVGSGDSVKVSCFPETKFTANFEIGTRTAYSLGGGNG